MPRKSKKSGSGTGYADVGDRYTTSIPIVPRQGDMSWIGEPKSEKAAAAYEKKRNEILKDNHDPEILEGIPRGVWASLWADEQEEKGESFSGVDLMEAAPATPGWAKKWAKEVADRIVEMNTTSLDEMYRIVTERGKYPHDRETFGYHLGMQAMGAGVSWSDDVDYKSDLKHDDIKIPYREFYRP